MSKKTAPKKNIPTTEDAGTPPWVYLLLIGGIAGVATGGYYAYKWLIKPKQKGNRKTTSVQGSIKTTSRSKPKPKPMSSWCKSTSYPLGYGNCHEDVRWLQIYLKRRFNADLGTYGSKGDGVDGKFGNVTVQAVKKHLGKTTLSKTDIAMLKQGITKLST